MFHDLAEAVRMGYSDLPALPTFAFVLTHKAMAAAMFDPDLALTTPGWCTASRPSSTAGHWVAGDEVVVTSHIADIHSRAPTSSWSRRPTSSRWTANSSCVPAASSRAGDCSMNVGDVLERSAHVERINLVMYAGPAVTSTPFTGTRRSRRLSVFRM